MQQQLTTMLSMQDAMNRRVHDDWRDKNLEWYRAIWIECAELLDHYGWKWWKKQVPDRDQVVLELIDIWHFGLSIVLMDSADTQDAVEFLSELSADLDLEVDESRFRDDVEHFALQTLSTRKFDVAGFARMMSSIGLSFDELYRRYVGKNVLNFFRQDHGYKEGHYHKMWHGREDNEHLVEVVDSLDSGETDFKEQVYQALKARYSDTLGA